MFKYAAFFTAVLFLAASCGGVKVTGQKDGDTLAVNDTAATDDDSTVTEDEDTAGTDIPMFDTADDPANDDDDATDISGGDDSAVIPDADFAATCGNGSVDGGEACDGTIDNCVEIDPYQYASGKAVCLEDCTGWDTETCVEIDPCSSHYTYDCYDGDVYYYDSCGNLEDIKEECGTSGYTGSNYCSSGDLYRDYVTRGCSSYACTENTEGQVVEYCDYGCTGTACNAAKADIWYDSTSGLTWQNTGISTYAPSGGTTACANLSLGGYSDWRLPTISELRSLVRSCAKITTGGTCSVTSSCATYASCYNSSNCGSCTVGSGPSDTGMYWDAELLDVGTAYWSSTVLSDYPTTTTWYIDFSTGTLTYQDNVYAYSVRCVRGAQPTTLAAPTNVSATDGTYTGYIHISWSAVTNADSYYIYRSTSSTGTYSVVASAVPTPDHYDYPPAGNTYYYYKVIAYSSSLGSSDYSAYDAGWCY